MSIEETVQNYIINNEFIPHINNNSMRYGLNEFGCESIISYNNDIWKFVWFITNTNNAVYMNKDGEKFILTDNYNDNIIRMQKV